VSRTEVQPGSTGVGDDQFSIVRAACHLRFPFPHCLGHSVSNRCRHLANQQSDLYNHLSWSVNLRALPTGFKTICLNRLGHPPMFRNFRRHLAGQLQPFLVCPEVVLFMQSAKKQSRRSNSIVSNRAFGLPTGKVRISLITVRRESAEALARLGYSCCSGLRSSQREFGHL
jgi:hypothetical protein